VDLPEWSILPGHKAVMPRLGVGRPSDDEGAQDKQPEGCAEVFLPDCMSDRLPAQWPLAIGRLPLAIGRWPLSTDHWPLAAVHGPLVIGPSRLAAGHGPRTVGHWPLAIGRCPRTSGHWPSAVGSWPLATGGWPSAIGHRPPSTDFRCHFFRHFLPRLILCGQAGTARPIGNARLS
jgi:hypothetical protein